MYPSFNLSGKRFVQRITTQGESPPRLYLQLKMKVTINHIWKWRETKSAGYFFQGKKKSWLSKRFQKDGWQIFPSCPTPKPKIPLTSLHVSWTIQIELAHKAKTRLCIRPHTSVRVKPRHSVALMKTVAAISTNSKRETRGKGRNYRKTSLCFQLYLYWIIPQTGYKISSPERRFCPSFNFFSLSEGL